MKEEKTNRVTFYESYVSLREAKRQASQLFNNRDMARLVDKFDYVTNDYTYIFTRINKISPDGCVIFGTWKTSMNNFKN